MLRSAAAVAARRRRPVKAATIARRWVLGLAESRLRGRRDRLAPNAAWAVPQRRLVRASPQRVVLLVGASPQRVAPRAHARLRPVGPRLRPADRLPAGPRAATRESRGLLVAVRNDPPMHAASVATGRHRAARPRIEAAGPMLGEARAPGALRALDPAPAREVARALAPARERPRLPVRHPRRSLLRGGHPAAAVVSNRASTIGRQRARGREVRQLTGVRRLVRLHHARGRDRAPQQPHGRRHRGRADPGRLGFVRSETPPAAPLRLVAGGATIALPPPGRAAPLGARRTTAAARRVGRPRLGLRDVTIEAHR